MTADDRYRLSNSDAAAAAFRAVADRARAERRLKAFAVASRWIVEELARTPSEFGESREHLADAGIVMRCGFARPVYVEYGVHADSRTVFLRRFELLPPTPEETSPAR